MRKETIGMIGAVALALGMAGAGCGSSTSTTGGTGGSASTGGSANTGGSAATGGAMATGGAASTGGTTATGGQTTSGNGKVTSLDGSKTIGTLSKDEATKLCDETYAYFKSATPQAIACKWKALSYATSSSAPTQEKLRSNCSTKEASCLSDTSTTGNPGCGELPSTCKATVTEYATCIADEVSSFNKSVEALPKCDAFTFDGTQAIWDMTGADLPASCLALSGKCPSLYPPDPR